MSCFMEFSSGTLLMDFNPSTPSQKQFFSPSKILRNDDNIQLANDETFKFSFPSHSFA